MPILKACALKQPTVGQFVRELRQLMGSTQELFAHQLGVSYETVSRWENGKMQPSPLAFRQIEQVALTSAPGQTLLGQYGLLSPDEEQE